MTKIVFLRRDGIFYGFEEHGHTGFADSGDDILCSALSAMTMLIVNTCEIAYAANVDCTVDDDSADVTLKVMEALPEYCSDEKKRFAISGLLTGYYYQLNDLTEEYYDYLSVDVKDEDEKLNGGN